MKSFSTNPAPAAPEPEDTAQNTRLEALNEIAIAAFIISAICILVNFQTWGSTTALSSYPLWLNAALCAGFGVLNWYRRPSFQVRSALLVAVLYGGAVGAFVIFGMGGAGIGFLIAASLLASILLGFQIGAFVTGLAVVTGVGFIYYYLATPAVPQLTPEMLNTWGAWASIGGNLTLVFAVLIVPQRHLWESQAFVLAVSKQKQELLETRATLQKQTRQMEMASAELAGVNIQLQEQSRTLERRAQQLAAAAEIGRAATSSLDLATLLETSVNLIRDRFGFYHASVFIVEPGTDIAELRESTGEAGRQLKARRHKLALNSKSLVGTATSTRHPVIVQDVTVDPNYYPNPLLPDTRAEAVLPLLRGETVLGAVDVQSTLPNAFAESDLAILSAITDQLSVAIQNARLYTETQQAVSENAALFKISAALAVANSLQDILTVVVENALPQAATRAALLLMHYDPDGQPLDVEVRAHYDAEGKLQRTGLRVPVAALPLLSRLQEGAIVVPDIYSDPAVDPVTRETMAKLEMISACIMPLRSGGRLDGALIVMAAQPAEFSQAELDLMRSAVDQVVVTLEKFRLLEEAHRRAEQSTAAAEIGRAATATFDLPTLLETTVNLIRDRFGFYHASVFIVEPGSHVAELRESTGEAGRKLKERKHKLAVGSKSLVGSATATRQPVVVQDVRADPGYYPNPLLPDTRAEAVLPMLSGDQVIGAVDVQSTTPGAFIESEVAILATIVGQLAVAVQNARLYVETQARLNELATLNEVSRAISASIDLDLVFRAVREQLATALDTDNLYLGLYDEGRNQITFPFMLERGQLIPFEAHTPTGRMQYILKRRQPLLLQGDAAQIAEQLQRLGITSTGVAKSYLGVPLALGDRAIGVLAVQDFDRANSFNANHQRILTTVADQLAVAIQNARLYAETQDRLSELATLNQLSRAFSGTLDLEQVFQIVREQVPSVMNTTDIALALYDEAQGSISFPFALERGQELHLPTRPLSGLNGQIIRTREPVLLQGTLDEVNRKSAALGGIATDDDSLSYFGVPLVAGQRVVGALAVESFERLNAFDENHQRLLTTIADQLAVTIQNARLYAETQARLGEIVTLNETSRAFASTLDLDQVYQIVRDRLARVMGTGDLVLALYDEVQNLISFAFALERGQELHLAPRPPVGKTGYIIRTQAPLLIQGSLEEVRQRVEAVGGLNYEAGLQPSYFGIPLIVGQRVLGVLAAQDFERFNAFDGDQQRLMTAIGGLLAVTLQNTSLFAQTQTSLAETEDLYQGSADLNAANTFDGILNVIRQYTVAGEGTHIVSISLFDQPANESMRPQMIDAVAFWSSLPPEQTARLPRRFRVADFPAFDSALHPDRLTVVEDFATNPVMSAAAQALYQQGLGARSVIFAPLKVSDQWMGYINLLYAQPRQFSEASLRQLTALTGQAAVAINSLRLFEETRSALSENATLFKISSALTEADSMQDILEVIIANAMPPGCTRSGLLWIIYNDHGEAVEIEVRAHMDITGEYQRLGLRLPAQAGPFMYQLQGEPVAISNIDAYPGLDPVTRETMRRMKMIATCFIPIVIGGRLAGVMTTSASQPVDFHPRDIAVLRGVSDLAAVTLEKLQLLDETRRRAEQLAAATEIGRAATASLELSSVLATTVNLIRDRFGYYHASIFIIEPGSDMAEVRESTGEAGQQLKARKHKLAVGSQSLVGSATAQHEPVVVQDVHADPNYFPNPLLPDTRAEAVLPLIVGDTVVGAMDVQSTLRGAFTPSDIAILSTITGQLAVAVQNAGLFAQTQAAVAENASFFKISRALSEANSVRDILEAVMGNALPPGCTVSSLLWIIYNEQGEIDGLEVRGQLRITGEYARPDLRLPPMAASFYGQLKSEPVAINNIDDFPAMDSASRENLHRMGFAAACFVPTVIGGRLAAILSIYANQPVDFQPRDIAVLRGVGDLLAVTLEKLQLLDETQRRAEQLAAASEIGRAATASFDLPSVLATTVNLIRDRFGFYHASIFIIEPGSNMAEVRESTGEAGRQLKARKHRLAVGSKSLVGTATANRRPVVVQDVRADPSYYPNPLLPDTRAEAVIPLIAGDIVVGALDVQSTLRGIFTAGDTAILSTVAGQLAVAVQNARLYEQTARWANRERLANQITTKIRAVPAGDIDGMLRTAVTELRQALGTSHGAIQLRSNALPQDSVLNLEDKSCERIPQCPFFNERMTNAPENARALKNAFCLGDKTKCARYRIATTVGSASVPPELFPDETKWADEIIHAAQGEGKS